MKSKFLVLIFFFVIACNPNYTYLKVYNGNFPPPIISEEMIWSSNGNLWNGVQYLGFNLKKKDKLTFRSAVYFTLDQLEDYKITNWVSNDNKYKGKIRVVRSFPTSDGYCRVYQTMLIKKNNAVRLLTNKACKRLTYSWSFYK